MTTVELVKLTRSAVPGQFLVASLITGLWVSSLDALLTLIRHLTSAPDKIVDPWALPLMGIEGILILSAATCFIVWMIGLQFDLADAFPNYPIKPQAALPMILVPFYNIWGNYHLLTVMSDFLCARHDELIAFGKSVRTWIPIVYLFMLTGGFWSYFLSQATHPQPTWVVLQAMYVPLVWLVCIRLTQDAAHAATYALHRYDRVVDFDRPGPSPVIDDQIWQENL